MNFKLQLEFMSATNLFTLVQMHVLYAYSKLEAACLENSNYYSLVSMQIARRYLAPTKKFKLKC